MSNPTCPFCGVKVNDHLTVDGGLELLQHPKNDCHLMHYSCSEREWNRRAKEVIQDILGVKCEAGPVLSEREIPKENYGLPAFVDDDMAMAIVEKTNLFNQLVQINEGQKLTNQLLKAILDQNS